MESGSEVTFLRQLAQRGFGPGFESLRFGFALLLPQVLPDVGGLAVDFAFDVVKPADAIERLLSDLGLGGRPDVMEVPAQQAASRNCRLPSVSEA